MSAVVSHSTPQTPTACHQGKELTPSACRSATPCPLFTAPTALANSSLVCSSSASMSAGPRPSSIRRSAARSGLSRKNSRQKPSVRSSSSSSLKSSPVSPSRGFGFVGKGLLNGSDRGGLCQITREGRRPRPCRKLQTRPRWKLRIADPPPRRAKENPKRERRTYPRPPVSRNPQSQVRIPSPDSHEP